MEKVFGYGNNNESKKQEYRRNTQAELWIERDDTGRYALIKIETKKRVRDLLELSRSKLNFSGSAVLSAYRKTTGKLINKNAYVRDVTHETIVIKHTIKESRENEKSTIRKDKDFVSPICNHDIRNDGLAAVSKLEEGEEKSSSSVRHRHSLNKNFQGLQESYDPLKIKLIVEDKTKEIDVLNRKLRIGSCTLRGFEFQIVPMEYVPYKLETVCNSFFSSDEELQVNKSKISKTNNWSSWQPDGGFPCLGVRVSGNSDHEFSYWPDDSNKNTKARTAIVTRTSFYETRKFSVQVTLNEMAIFDAKEILKASQGEQQTKAINYFNDKYCSFVYSGQFSAGGWFRKIAIASCSKAIESATLVEEAKRKLEADRGGYRLSYGFQDSFRRQFNMENNIYVTVKEKSEPFAICERDLEKNISDVWNWTVFPAVGARKAQFTPVYEIMANQALVIGDEKLSKVSAIVKMHMKGTNRLPIDEVMGDQAKTFRDEGMEAGENNLRLLPDDVEKMEIDDADYEELHDRSAHSRMHIKGASNTLTNNQQHYVVVLGDVGTGKSTVVEKLTGQTGRSSDASESFTRTSEYFYVPDGSLIISDTPGSNSRKDKLQHNHWIASALNFMPVSKIFIVVRAEHRIDSVIDSVLKYADNFVELPFDAVGVLVTHMDKVEWAEEEFTQALDDELGIDAVVFSRIDTEGGKLLTKILSLCKERHDLSVNDKNFSKLFKIKNSHRKVLQFTSDEVKEFSKKKNAFEDNRKAFSNRDQVDLVFEFYTYMTDALVETKTRMIEYNNFKFEGENAALEGGHVLNMVNQLNMVLRDIRIECTRHNCEHDVSGFRKCPYCGLIWAKKEGCSEDAICQIADRNNGHHIPATEKTQESTVAVLGTFSFKWTEDKLVITKSGKKSGEWGCGRTINWDDMAAVNAPFDIVESQRVRKSKKSSWFPQWNLGGRVWSMVAKIEQSLIGND